MISSLCGDVIQFLESRDDAPVEPEAPQQEAGQDPEQGGAEVTGSTTHSGASDDADPVAQAEHSGGMDPSTFAHFSAELAGLDTPGEVLPPQDPALRRLLPDGSADPEEASQLRRLSESSLRASKAADLRLARMALESSPVALSEEQAPAFGRALNDVRLVLSVRLGIESQEDADALHDRVTRSRGSRKDAHASDSGQGPSSRSGTDDFMAEIYTFITWLQESLFQAMVDFLPEDTGPGEADDEGDAVR